MPLGIFYQATGEIGSKKIAGGADKPRINEMNECTVLYNDNKVH